MIRNRGNTMVLNKKYQAGATMWGWLALIVMIGFIAMIAFKVVPLYFDHSIIRSTIQEVVDNSEFSDMSNKSITRAISNRMTVNNIRNIDAKSFQTKLDKRGRKYILIRYDRKVHIMSNASALVEFDEEIRPTR